MFFNCGTSPQDSFGQLFYRLIILLLLILFFLILCGHK